MRSWLHVLLLMLAASASAADDGLLPGEFPIELALRGGVKRFPTMKVIAESAKQEGAIKPLLPPFCFHSDANDHYAPKWSSKGTHLAFLRADLRRRSCKIIFFKKLSDPHPVVLFEDKDSYDHMFSWAVSKDASSEGAFVFASTNNDREWMEIYHGDIDAEPIRLTEDKRVKRHPALWIGPVKKEGQTRIETRIVYDAMGELELISIPSRLRADMGIQRAHHMAPGTMPAWRPGAAKPEIVYLKDKTRGKGKTIYNIWTRDVDSGLERCVFANDKNDVLRNPTWSPDGKLVAFLSGKVKRTGAGTKAHVTWNIVVIKPPSRYDIRPIAQDVVIEDKFASVGPTWTPDSQKLYFFRHKDEQQGYYPISWVNVESKGEGKIDYPRVLTTPNDLAVVPTNSRAVALVGVERVSQGLFLMILNKF